MSRDYSLTDEILKRHYVERPEALQRLYIDEFPLQAIMPKKTDLGGSYWEIAMIEAPVPSSSATFAATQSQSQGASSKTPKYSVTPIRKYALCQIDGMEEAATEQDINALIDAVKLETEQKDYDFKFTLETQLMRNGSGKIATMTTYSTTTATLADASETALFMPGMKCVFAADEASAARNSGVTRTVSSVSPSTSQVVFTASLAGGDSIGTTDSIFRYGDYLNASDRLCVTGLGGWNPQTAPSSSENFFGKDRSLDEFRLSGPRYDGTTNNENILDTINNGLALAHTFGSKPDLILIGTQQAGKLLAYLRGNVVYNVINAINEEGELLADVGFETIDFYTPTAGKISVMVTPFAVYNLGKGIRLEKWRLGSMGGCPRILPSGGDLTVYNADAREYRVGFYGNAGCYNTLHNVAFKFMT